MLAPPSLQEINSMGITYEGNYSFVDTSGGDVVTELGEARGSVLGSFSFLGARKLRRPKDT